MSQQTHIRGLQLIPPGKLTDRLHGWSFRQQGMPIGYIPSLPLFRRRGVIIPPALQNQHFLIAGASGAGKTTLIRDMIDTIIRHNQPAIIVDSESTLLREYYRPGRDRILQPLDQRCPYWDPWSEFRPAPLREMDIKAFATSLFRGADFIRDQQQEFFLEASRRLTTALFGMVKSVDELFEFLRQPPHVMQRLLRNTEAFATIYTGAQGQTGGILGQVSNKLEPFRYLPRKRPDSDTWVAREWADNPSGFLFLSSKQDNRAASSVLQGLWLDTLTRYLLNAPEDDARQVWVIIDELALLGYQGRVLDLAIGGRKRSVCLVASFQNMAQVRKIYGKEDAETLTSQPRTKILFAGGSTETNEWASEIISKQEINRTLESHSQSTRGGRSTSSAEHRVSSHLAIAPEIEQLPVGQAYVAIRGYDRAKVVVPKHDPIFRHPDFIPRAHREPTIEPEIVEPEPTAHASFKAAKPLPTAAIWSGMVARCTDPNHVGFPHYGGRRRCLKCRNLYPGDGRNCDKCGAAEWEKAPVLLLFNSMDEITQPKPEGIGPRPTREMTIDRKDSRGHYERGNVQWLEREKQNANRRNSKRVQQPA